MSRLSEESIPWWTWPFLVVGGAVYVCLVSAAFLFFCWAFIGEHLIAVLGIVVAFGL